MTKNRYQPCIVGNVVTGVQFVNSKGKIVFVCKTLFESSHGRKNYTESERWALKICAALNKEERLKEQKAAARPKTRYNSTRNWNE